MAVSTARVALGELHQIASIVGCERLSIMVADWAHNELYAQGTLARVPSSSGIAGKCMAGGAAGEAKSELVNDVQSNPNFNPSVDLQTGHTTTSLLCSPVILHQYDSVVAVVSAVNKTQGFCSQDVHTVEGFCRRVADLITENAGLCQEAPTPNQLHELTLQVLPERTFDVTPAPLHSMRSSLTLPQGTHLSSTITLDAQDSIAHSIVDDGSQRRTQMRILVPGDDADGIVRVVDQVLSPEECKSVIETAGKYGFSAPRQFDSSTRKCERLHTIDTQMSDVMMERIRADLPEQLLIDGVRWRLDRFTHHWRYVHYTPGGHFRPHYDGAKMFKTSTGQFKMSCFTVQIYLNDEFSGGKTRFYTDYQAERKPSHQIIDGKGCDMFNPPNPPTHSVDPETGRALIFSHVHNTLHDGEPVTHGDKYILRGDVVYSAIEEDVELILNPKGCPEDRMFCLDTAARQGTRNYVGQVWICACAVDGHGCHHHHSHEAATPAATSVVANSGENGMTFVLCSGHRAAGKDHIAGLLYTSLAARGVNVMKMSLGSINKRCYAKAVGIDPLRLEADRVFKEEHRLQMIEFHARRNQDNPFWCLDEVLQTATAAGAEVLILSDLRTYADLEYFQNKIATNEGAGSLILVRVDATDGARIPRGWQSDETKDGLYTEVELDGFHGWTTRIDNSDNSPDVGARILHQWVKLTALPRILGN